MGGWKCQQWGPILSVAQYFPYCKILKFLALSCPGMARAVVKIGHSNMRPGSKELLTKYIMNDVKTHK